MPTEQPVLKPVARRLFFVAYYALAWASVVALPHVSDRTHGYPGLLTLLWLACLVSVLLMTQNLMAFPFQYSLFGPYRRTPFPDEEPVLIGWLTGALFLRFGFCNCYVFPSGLGISVVGSGKVYIPVAYLTGVKAVGFFLVVHSISHGSPELRFSIKASSVELLEAVRRIRDAHRQNSPGMQEIGEAISRKHGVPTPRIRRQHEVSMELIFPVPCAFPDEKKLRAVASEAASMLSEHDLYFNPDEHLSIRFAHGEKTRAWWRNGKLEMVGQKSEKNRKEA